ncbi:GTPase Era [Aquicella lusitana]|uniref:GTPase Era n=1 Tax=Aquicella lusitana TaxID=254246 RepID=A0A370GG92_9COXI|nr:GTPase Era [Aquicella lusitana]RDI42697.1 GTP-binding protein Era [Aquicella lusitana]VVC73448.1 GTPase Era [Aquicella lusitana]
MNEAIEKSGYVAIIGRPNVGKSTLLNCLLGEKLSITSPKPQTTRWQILGIKTLPQAQIIYMDTPGVHKSEKRAMNRYMNRIANAVLIDADVIVFMIDATKWHSEDELVLKKLASLSKPVILAINKIDRLKDKALLLPLIEKLKDKLTFAQIVPISALEVQNIPALEDEIIKLLPEGPQLYPEDQITDKGVRFHIAEVIREKLIQATEEELPYATTIEIEQFEESDKLVEIGAVIWVERQGQKVIIIGKKGAKLKKIGIQARREIEKYLDRKVFLRLWVKVKEDWTDNEKALRSLGYE